MNKYIDRDKLAEFARHSTIGIDANDIMRFPTADVVEVVRCKDCKKAWLKDDKDTVRYCSAHCIIKRKDDFCSCGERRKK